MYLPVPDRISDGSSPAPTRAPAESVCVTEVFSRRSEADAIDALVAAAQATVRSDSLADHGADARGPRGRRWEALDHAHAAARHFAIMRRSQGAQAERMVVELKSALARGTRLADVSPDAWAKTSAQIVAWCIASYYDMGRAD